ncbi:MAG: secretin N-terminal domain-containing protein [Candidatus Omnitrophota bacterium]
MKVFILLGLILSLSVMLSAEETGEETGLNKKVSLDLRNIDAIEALKYIAKTGELNFAIGKGISGRITLSVENVTLKDALDIVLISNDLAYEKKGDIYSIMTAREYETMYGRKFSDPREMRIFKLTYASPDKVFKILEGLKSEVGRILVDEETGSVILIDTKEKLSVMEQTLFSLEGGVPLEVFNLQYAKAKEVEARLTAHLAGKKVGVIVADEKNNQIIVQALARRMDDIRKLIKQLDKKTKEVLIETNIIKVDLNKGSQFGISWEGLFSQLTTKGVQFIGSHPYDSTYRMGNTSIDNYSKIDPTSTLPALAKSSWTGSVYFGQVTGSNQYEGLLNFLQTFGTAKVLSAPKLAVVDGQEAKILIGTKEVYSTSTTAQAASTTTVSEEVHFIDVGIKLLVTPTINDEGYITMIIKPEISNVVRYYTTSSGNQIPIVDTAQVESTVFVKDGVSLLIAGLRKEEKTEDSEGIPFLSKLPLIGKLFKDTTTRNVRAELLILLTPHIITGDELITGEEKPLGNEVMITPEGKKQEKPVEREY